MHLQSMLPSILLLLLTTPSHALLPSSSNKVLLSKVKTLTLRKGSETAHRRVSAAPQLKCLTPRTCAHYQVDIMRCTNQGSDYEDENIQWSCSSNMPEDFKLGSTDVICEGYDSSDDPYVLKGSCGVEYRLVLTDKGEEKYGKIGGGGGDATMSDAAKSLFWLLFIGVALWIIWGIWKGLPGNRRAGGMLGGNGGGWGGGNGGGWGGGNGGDDNDDNSRGPPPPYSKYGSTYSAAPRTRNQGAWRPGFWSGLGGGAAAGYAAGAMGSRSNRSTSSSSRASSSTSSPSSITHSSTGFGSTSRR